MKRHELTGNIVLQNSDDFELAIDAVDSIIQNDPYLDHIDDYRRLLERAREVNANFFTQIHLEDPRLSSMIELTLWHTLETMGDADRQLKALTALTEVGASGTLL